jgi:hypothetical protein
MTDDDGHGAFSPDGVNTQTDNALETTGAIPSCTNRNLRFNHARTNGRWMVFAGLRNLTDGACSENSRRI